jgi:hypothetical protein
MQPSLRRKAARLARQVVGFRRYTARFAQMGGQFRAKQAYTHSFAQEGQRKFAR